MRKKQGKSFLLGTLFGAVLCAIGLGVPMAAAGADAPIQVSTLPYGVYINGAPLQLEDPIIKDGKTYVQLRDFCNKINVTVDWKDPRHQMMPLPGGTMFHGINLTNPTYVYTAKINDFNHTDDTLIGVEITGIYKKYQDNGQLKYSFNDEGLLIRQNGIADVVPLKYYPSNGRYYLTIEEFKEKVQPYLVDICMQ